jgi:hypothetical protein
LLESNVKPINPNWSSGQFQKMTSGSQPYPRPTYRSDGFGRWPLKTPQYYQQPNWGYSQNPTPYQNNFVTNNINAIADSRQNIIPTQGMQNWAQKTNQYPDLKVNAVA